MVVDGTGTVDDGAVRLQPLSICYYAVGFGACTLPYSNGTASTGRGRESVLFYDDVHHVDGGRLDDGTKTATGARLKFEDPGVKMNSIASTNKLWRAARGCMCIVTGHMLSLFIYFMTL